MDWYQVLNLAVAIFAGGVPFAMGGAVWMSKMYSSVREIKQELGWLKEFRTESLAENSKLWGVVSNHGERLTKVETRTEGQGRRN